MVWRQIKAITLIPGVVTIAIPALIWGFLSPSTELENLPMSLRLTAIGTGTLLLALGLGLFVWTVALFARHGKGTLAPYDAPTRLVVAGPYRHVRNPMYAAVFAVLVGGVLVLQSWPILVWFVLFAMLVVTFVPRKEERWLIEQFAEQYCAYKRHVPRWIPRPTPWIPTF